jgi:hypothetical protein
MVFPLQGLAAVTLLRKSLSSPLSGGIRQSPVLWAGIQPPFTIEDKTFLESQVLIIPRNGLLPAGCHIVNSPGIELSHMLPHSFPFALSKVTSFHVIPSSALPGNYPDFLFMRTIQLSHFFCL